MRGARPCSIVVVGAEEIEAALQQFCDAGNAAGIALAGGHVGCETGGEEFAVGEIGPGMAERAAAPADEDLQPPLRGFGIARGSRRFAPRQGVAEPVERRRPAHQSFLEGGEHLADVHEHRIVIGGRGGRAKGIAVAARELLVAAHQGGHMARGCRQLAPVEDRAQALEPQGVRGAVPAEPARAMKIHQRRRVAVHLRHAGAAPQVVGPVALRVMAGDAGDRSLAGEALIEEQAHPELDRFRFPRDAVAGIPGCGRTPRPVGQDGPDLGIAEYRPRADALIGQAGPAHRQESSADGGKCYAGGAAHAVTGAWPRASGGRRWKPAAPARRDP